MKKTLFSIVIGVVGSATIASVAIAASVAFNSAPIDNIENNINTLKDKVVAYSNNEQKLVDKYMKLYEEYTNLKEATEQDSDVATYKEDAKNLESEIDRLKKELEKQEEKNKEQEDYIKELEEQIENLESNKVIQEEDPQFSDELEVE